MVVGTIFTAGAHLKCVSKNVKVPYHLLHSCFVGLMFLFCFMYVLCCSTSGILPELINFDIQKLVSRWNPDTNECTYHLCFLFPVPFTPFSTHLLPTGNSPCDLYFCDSVPVLVVCLVCFCSCSFYGSVVDSCEFIILLFIVLIIFFFLDKSL